MNRITLVTPLLALSAFGGYYHHWNAGRPAAPDTVSHPAPLVPPDPYASRDGRREAEADFAAGKMLLLSRGRAENLVPEYAGVLQRDYGIGLEPPFDGAMTPAQNDFTWDYNAAMKAAIRAKLGADVLDQAYAKAAALAAANHAPLLPPVRPLER